MNRTLGRRRTDASPADTRLPGPGHHPWRGAAPERLKFEPDPESPRHFLTLRGLGYRFDR